MSDSSPETQRSPVGTSIPFFTRLIATGFFSGYSPWASGTVGTLVGILLYLIPGFEQPAVLIAAIVVVFFAGVVTSARVAEVEGNRLTKMAQRAKERFQGDAHGVPDPSIVVIDEIAGVWITLLFVPKAAIPVIIAFFAFRGFDIIKPPPARQVEQIPNGWGIMLDDVIAGVYACCATHTALFVLRYLAPTLLP